VPYQSPNRCSRGRINWKGVASMERVPAGTSVISWERVLAAKQQTMTITIGMLVRDFVCTRFTLGLLGGHEVRFFGTSKACAAWFAAKDEILPRMHSGCHQPCNREAFFSAF